MILNIDYIPPGGIYGHSMGSSSSGVVPPVSHTQITYNNYYNNGTAGEAQPGAAVVAPAAPAAAPAASSAATAEQPAAAIAATQQQQQQPQQQPQPQPQVPPPNDYGVTDAELQKFTEDIFAKDVNNAFKHITIKIQGHKTDDSTTDDAPEKLVFVLTFLGFFCII